MKKIKILLCCAACAVMLTACGQKAPGGEDVSQPTGSVDANVPDNVITESTETMPPETELSAPVSSDAAIPETLPEQQSEAEPEHDEPEQTSAEERPEDESDVGTETAEDSETRAAECLKLMNSNHVHIRFVQASIYDSGTAFSYDREIYADGDDRIYINDGNRTLVHGGVTTYINDDDRTYCVVGSVDDYGLNFGYDSSMYALLSAEDVGGVWTEIYSINGLDITSTWEFSEDGKLRVSDRSLKSSAVDLYDFRIIEYDNSGMDFSIPEGYTEQTEEEFGFNY